MEAKDWIPVLLVVGMFLFSAYLYAQLPKEVPVHWNAEGVADGFGSRFTGLYLIPIICAFILGLFQVLPKIGVFKENIEGFYVSYGFGFKLVLILFFSGIYGASVAQMLGHTFNMNYFIIPAVSFLFYYIGEILPNVKRNFFIGIRTPWTLSSDVVWEKTHILGGKVFKAISVLIWATLLFPDYFIVIFLVPVLGGTLALVLYSLTLARQEKKEKEENL
ncbi:MAG: DUF1648 domain-containing protein [Candidatus Altiarchaeota archaeon]